MPKKDLLERLHEVVQILPMVPAEHWRAVQEAIYEFIDLRAYKVACESGKPTKDEPNEH